MASDDRGPRDSTSSRTQEGSRSARCSALFVLTIAVLGLFLGAPSRAGAERIRLAYDAVASCPTEDVFRDLVLAQLSPGREREDLSFAVRIAEAGDLLRGVLIVNLDGAENQRVVEANLDACEGIVLALALAVSVALYDAEEAPAPRAEAAAAPLAELSTQSVASSALEQVRHGPTTAGRMSAELVLGGGLIPGVVLGGGVVVGAELGSFFVAGELRGLVTVDGHDRSGTRPIEAALLSAGLWLCAEWRVAQLCGIARAGGVWAGWVTSGWTSVSSVAMRVGVGLPMGPFAFRVAAEAEAPVIVLELFDGSERVWRAPAASGTAALGFEYLF
jgi:hypothetical protein